MSSTVSGIRYTTGCRLAAHRIGVAIDYADATRTQGGITIETRTRRPSCFGRLQRITERQWLGIILLLAMAARVLVALYLGNIVDAPPLLTDQRSYHALGERLIGGHGFSFDRPWYPFTAADLPTAHWSFLYSLFVAAVYGVFGAHPLAVRLVQALLGGALLPGMVYLLTKRVFPTRQWTPLLGAGIAACHPYLVLYAATLMTETFFIALLLWSLVISIDIGEGLRLGRTVRWRDWGLLGLCLGLTTLMRQSILPWLPFLYPWLLWQGRRGRQRSSIVAGLAACTAILFAFVLPWTIRNYHVYGQFLLLNSNTGYAMYSAQHRFHGTRFSEFVGAPLPEGVGWGNEAEMDRALLRLGIGFVLDDPRRYLLLSLSRIRAYLEFWPNPETAMLHNVGRVASFALTAPFTVYGIFLAIRRSLFRSGAWLILCFVLVYSLLHIFTWAMVRYRLPVDATLLPLAALGIEELLKNGKALVHGSGTVP